MPLLCVFLSHVSCISFFDEHQGKGALTPWVIWGAVFFTLYYMAKLAIMALRLVWALVYAMFLAKRIPSVKVSVISSMIMQLHYFFSASPLPFFLSCQVPVLNRTLPWLFS